MGTAVRATDVDAQQLPRPPRPVSGMGVGERGALSRHDDEARHPSTGHHRPGDVRGDVALGRSGAGAGECLVDPGLRQLGGASKAEDLRLAARETEPAAPLRRVDEDSLGRHGFQHDTERGASADLVDSERARARPMRPRASRVASAMLLQRSTISLAGCPWDDMNKNRPYGTKLSASMPPSSAGPASAQGATRTVRSGVTMARMWRCSESSPATLR